MTNKEREALLDPLFNNNPIGLQVLGICSALAVTTQMWQALVMSVAVIAVTIRLLRNLDAFSLEVQSGAPSEDGEDGTAVGEGYEEDEL